MAYQERLLLYADILGWKAEIARDDGVNLLSAVQDIHRRAEDHNEQARKKLIAQEGTIIQTDLGPMRVERVNRMALEVQFGAFSDHFVFSLPASFGSRILSIASKLIIDLLRVGFLTRGAVVFGPLYHCDNVIFGPALLEAVKIEEREAFYPRVLVSDAAVDHYSKLPNDLRDRTMITDQTGRSVVNPFAMPFDGTDEVIESFVQLNLFLPQIKAKIGLQIDSLEKQSRRDHAEKWRYLEQFIVGPVFEAAPKLRRFWH
jgi:hypothetical protein